MTTKTKVLMLSKFYYPHVGGVERHIEFLSKQLNILDYEISLISEKHLNTLKNEEIVGCVNVFRFNYPRVKYLGILTVWLKMILLYYDLIRSSDIIHIHDVFIWYLPFVFLFPRKRVFVTFHGYESYPIRRMAIIQRQIASLLTKGNICIGDFMKKWYGTKATIVSYGAVDQSRFKPCSSKIVYDAVFASRLDEQTGILTYLNALKILKSKGVDLKIVVLGDGKYTSRARRESVYLGFVNDPSKYIRKSRYAFVSRYLAILEAFACKKPVFAVFDNPVKKDYLIMAPFSKFIFLSNSPNELVKQLIGTMEKPDIAKEKAELAYKWVKEQTWQKMADNYIHLWEHN